ncbi:hypothetical protein VDBG_03122 [Verticillium alfalfae VaMs.102]|uniref:Uncharacterized protein n=1 Tax=Verticillium alfalfae (strain VaMs.102 / ATCC MYA-4576 / FGSC 10136) TaxID=526221 RepID=C9SD48_VERA1|nr:hypothetical protein VDBG_03122 [Verticillium alfalfae VaMs.102]EEY17013.1 hypothetical protein VDBG_03122 [Verticillium alfalfae VaMs.102]
MLAKSNPFRREGHPANPQPRLEQPPSQIAD